MPSFMALRGLSFLRLIKGLTSIKHKLIKIARKLKALIKKILPIPAKAIKNPAAAGPTTRPVLNMAEFKPMAECKSSFWIISIKNACEAGPSKESVMPESKVININIGRVIVWVMTNMPRVAANIRELVWVQIKIFFLFNLSTKNPPKREKNKTGEADRAEIAPNQKAEWVS